MAGSESGPSGTTSLGSIRSRLHRSRELSAHSMNIRANRVVPEMFNTFRVQLHECLTIRGELRERTKATEIGKRQTQRGSSRCADSRIAAFRSTVNSARIR